MVRASLRVLTSMLVFAALAAAERRIAVIVDTSGSMNRNDRQRYAVQISKILSDVTQDGDRVMIIRMPAQSEALSYSLRDILTRRVGENCSPGPKRHLGIELSGDRGAHKEAIDRLLVNDTGTYFAAPIDTAIEFLGTSPAVSRMMLFLADSGGFETNCTADLNARLERFRSTGAFVPLINLGATAGTFRGNPAFDSTAAAPDSAALVQAVARVYQQFLGAKKVQTGGVRDQVTVEIDPYVKEAYLVVAVDGELGPLRANPGNPGAESMDANYRGGGSTIGLDSLSRGYKIVRLKNPGAGRWTFSGMAGETGGWMLIQDYAITLRAVAGQAIVAGDSATVELEAVDERTGKRITGASVLSGLRVQTSAGAATSRGDGTFTVRQRLDKGRQTMQARIISESLDRAVPVTIDAGAGGWRITPMTASSGQEGAPVEIRARLDPVGPGVPPPPSITAELSSGERVTLNSSGGGTTYSGSWTPRRSGRHTIQYTAASSVAAPASSEIEIGAKPPPAIVSEPPKPQPAPTPAPPSVTSEPPPPPMITAADDFRFGTPSPVNLGDLKSGKTGEARLELTGANITGDADMQVRSTLNLKHTELEIETPAGWKKLSSTPQTVRLSPSGPASWRVRLRVAGCPAGCLPTEKHSIEMSVTRANGKVERVEAPVQVTVAPDPWLHCNWHYLAAALSLLICAAMVYGFIWPSRFPPRSGVQLSPEEDLSEGAFYSIRNQPGSGIGFYRHARVFVSTDHRVTGRRANAFVRLRADGTRVRIQPVNGHSVWRLRMDGEWEALPPNESLANHGTTYRNDDSTVFFDLRMR